MNKKDLTDLGIAEDVAEKIIVLHGKDIEKHKSMIQSSTTEIEGLKTQLTEASKQIEAFKGMDIEGVKKAADDWKTKAETAEADAKKQVAALKFEHALDGALSGEKAKNAKAVRALLNMDALKLNDADGSIIGLKEQIEKIKSENDYLFEGEKQDPKIVVGGNNQKITDDAFMSALRKGAGIPEGK